MSYVNIITALKSAKIARYIPLGLGLVAFVLAMYGIGSAIDSGNYNRKVKKAQKRALKLQQQEIAMKNQTLNLKA